MDAERKYEEVARKMNMMENDLEKAMNRAEGCEDKIVDREHELKVIGDNMKAMEVRKNNCVSRKNADLSLILVLSFLCNRDQVSEEKAHQREDILKDQIRHLVSRLKVFTSSKQKKPFCQRI